MIFILEEDGKFKRRKIRKAARWSALFVRAFACSH